MIVAVRPWDNCPYHEYVDVPVSDEESARRIAFISKRKRKCDDYNHLVHNTFVISVEKLSPDMVNFIKGM